MLLERNNKEDSCIWERFWGVSFMDFRQNLKFGMLWKRVGFYEVIHDFGLIILLLYLIYDNLSMVFDKIIIVKFRSVT